MTEPVVRLKLNPRRSEKVERTRGDESVPSKNPAADLARAGVQQAGLRFRERAISRHISTEAFSLRSHLRKVEVIVFSVRPARDQVFRWARSGTWPRHEVGRVVQISLTQNITKSEKTEEAQTRSPLMPGDAAI